MVNIYFAGKISKNDWREKITNFDVGNVLDGSYEGSLQLRNGVDIGDGDRYVGPFFVSCDHGCYHGPNSHGAGAGQEGCGCAHLTRAMVHRMCLDGIRRCDVLYAWIDSKDCFGTISEIGYAAALGKRIWIAYEKEMLSDMMRSNIRIDCMVRPGNGVEVFLADRRLPTHDMWFMSHFASSVHIGYDAVHSFRTMRQKHNAGI